MRILLLLLFTAWAVSPLSAQTLTIEVQSGLSGQVKKTIPLGDNLLVADGKGNVLLWDIKQDKIGQRLRITANELNDILYLEEEQLLLFAGSNELTCFRYSGGLLEFASRIELGSPTALYRHGASVWVATEKSMVALSFSNGRLEEEKAFPHGEGAFYTLHIKGDKLLALNNKGAFVYSLTQQQKIDSSLEWNTGWYAHHWDESRELCYLPRENSLMAVQFDGGKITWTKTTLPIAREEYITGITLDKQNNLYAATRSGQIFRPLLNKGLVDTLQPAATFRVNSGSVTHLSNLDEALIAGDYYGGVAVLEPVGLKEVMALNPDETPALTTVDFASPSRMITTHKGSTGSSVKLWDLAHASLLYSLPLKAQQVTAVTVLSADSFITDHADGASFRHYLKQATYVTETIKEPLTPFVVGTYIALPGEEMNRVSALYREVATTKENRQWITGDTAFSFNYNPPTVALSCDRLPPYQQVHAYIGMSGLYPYVKTWDIMDQDLFFMKACRSVDTVFYQYAVAKKIPLPVAKEFYKIIKRSDPGSLEIKELKAGGNLVSLPVLKHLDFFGTTGDRNLFLVLADDTAFVYNRQTGKLVRLPHQPLPPYFVYALNEQWLAIATEQTIRLYALDGSGGTSWIPFSKDNFLVHNEKGFFKTKGRTQRLAVLRDGVPLPFDYFDGIYNRPDLILKQLNKAQPEEIEAFTRAVEKRRARSGARSPAYIGALPLAWSEGYPDFPLFTSTGQLPVVDPGAKEQKLQLWVNGTREQWEGGLLQLNKGLNKLTWEVTSPAGDTTWYAQNNYVYNLDTTAKEQWFFLGAAIDQYADPRLNLNYARKDVRDLARLFQSAKPGLLVDTLVDEAVSHQGLKQWEKILRKATVNDVVVVSLSGHGFLDKELNFYFGTQQTTAKQLETAIPYTQLVGLLDNCKARKKLLLLDACHSGIHDDEAVATNLPPQIKIRGAAPEEESGKKSTKPFRLMQEEFRDLTKHNGTIVIAAAAGAEVAFETKAQQNGLFTYVLLQGLANKKADKDGDGIVLTSELQGYLNTEVELLSGGYQKPTTRQENLGIDWPFWK